MPGRRTDSGLALFIGALVGVAYPYLDLAASCRVPVSEACVWGKAYFPLTFGLSVILLGGITAGLAYLVLSWRRRRRGRR